MNKVILIGHLGHDPDLKYTASNAAVANFSIATSESWTDKSGKKEKRTDWHRIVVWGKLAELCSQYLSKGSQALIEGRLQSREYEDRNGQKKWVTEVQAMSVQFLDRPATATAPASASESFEPGMFG